MKNKVEDVSAGTRLTVIIGPLQKITVDKGFGLNMTEYKITVDVRRADGMHSSGSASITEVEVKARGLGKARTYAGTKLAMETMLNMLKLEEIP